MRNSIASYRSVPPVAPSWRDFRANLSPISLLAIGLVLFTTAFVAVLAHALTGSPWPAAFVLGAIISPTDAIAATAITNRLRVPQRIVTVLDGESLLNDATALVAYRFAIAAMMSGRFSLSEASGRFVLVALGGIGIGLAVGWLASHLQRRLDDPPVQITISLLTPFAAYIPAERLHVSSVLAVVASGLFLGWRGPQILTARTRLDLYVFWEMMVFLLNGLVFILIGLQLPRILHALSGQSLKQLVWHGALGSCAAIVVRIVWVFTSTYLLRLMSTSLPKRDLYPAWRKRGDCCVDRDARRSVAGGCARGAADAFGRQPFPRTRLHFVHHLLRDSRDGRVPRSEFARADSPAWSGG